MALKYFVLAINLIISLNNLSSFALDGGDTLLLGDSLTGNETRISKNGTFELGIFSPIGMNNSYVGIWYARISPKVVVWVANRDKPVKSIPSVLKFSSNGHLRLFDRNGLSVWSPDIGLKGSRAVITESGNFIMLGHGDNNSEIVWESFAHPGDTWLPGMKFWTGMKLTSWKSSSDPATGLFSLGADPSPGKTQLVMTYNNSVPYWSTGEWTGNYFTKVPEGIYIPRTLRDRYDVSCVRVSPSRFYCIIKVSSVGHFLTARVWLNENGEFKTFYRMDDGTWSAAWSTYGGQCSDYDICGAYGLCNPNDVCSCVEGFTPKTDSQGW